MLRCISRACVIINRAIIINHPLSITSGYSQVRYLTSRHLKILSERKRLPEKLIQKACVFVRHAHCVKLQVFIHLKHFNYFPMMILLKKCFPIFWPSVMYFLRFLIKQKSLNYELSFHKVLFVEEASSLKNNDV